MVLTPLRLIEFLRTQRVKLELCSERIPPPRFSPFYWSFSRCLPGLAGFIEAKDGGSGGDN